MKADKQPQHFRVNKQRLRFTAIAALLFTLLIVAQFGCLIAAACIPRTDIQHNLEESSALLNRHEVFFYASASNPASRIDRYADSILMNIIYYYDSEHPVTSVLRSSYYHTDSENENMNLKYALANAPAPTLEYSRYWHGSIALLRPLLLILNLKQIYILLGSTLLLLTALLILCMIRYRYGRSTILCFLTGLIMISIWYVPFSLEYIWTFLLMNLACILVTVLYEKGQDALWLLLMCIGSLTAYFDFLTTETLTLLVPLALILIKAYQPSADRWSDTTFHLTSFSDGVRFSLPACLLWLLAYAGTWSLKWGIGSLILHENLFQSALSQASFRLSGAIDITDQGIVDETTMLLQAIPRNLYYLFPFSYLGQHAVPVIFLTLFGIAFFYYMTRRGSHINPLPLLLGILACVPLLRYLVLSNHSYIHCFFTYRALFATIFCIGTAVCQGVDADWLKKKWRKLWNPSKSRTARKRRS
jgi:hypothetical protein